MGRLDLDSLETEERAFLELVAGLHRQLETLKLVFPPGRMRTAIGAMQAMNAALVAAALE